MSLCFIEPQNAIRVIADSVGREARRQILGEVVRAWVDEIPEPELEAHYAKAVADLDELGRPQFRMIVAAGTHPAQPASASAPASGTAPGWACLVST